jgi:eukaryotic-like serine/threonine-protein kinase
MLAAGTRVGPYEVLSWLGAGGMGEVYRARDTTLDREVALKTLPEELARQPDRLARLKQEARILASLNHPGIATLHGLEESKGGVPVLVMELVEGESLAERLRRGALPWREAATIAHQIALALEAAHEKGVLHRDLKPGNIRLARDGRVKLLDFGLAKAVRKAAVDSRLDTETSPHSEAGAVSGTAPYMSPEQARGQEVDRRSDIWAFGCVLYEMLAGKRAFAGATFSETVAAVLEREPDWSALPQETPPAVLRLLRRCLQKEKEKRLRDVGGARLELAEVMSGRDRANSWKRRALAAGLLLAAGLVAAGLAAVLLSSRRPVNAPLPPLDSMPIFSFPGAKWGPALSPDGRQVAFGWDGAGEEALYVKLVGSGDPLRLTHGSGGAYGPAWSPDAREIAFLRHPDKDRANWHEVAIVPALGGPERRLARTTAFIGHTLAWSPDGRSLAIGDKASPDEPDAIFLLDIETGEKRRVTTPRGTPSIGDWRPAFAPDGRTLAFIRKESNLFFSTIWIQPLAGGNPERLPFEGYHIYDIDWTPDGTALVAAASRNQEGSRLWRVPISGAEPSPLPLGENAAALSVARTGHRLAYAGGLEDMNIWRTPGPTAAQRTAPRAFIQSSRKDWHPTYSPDGQRIAFSSGRSGQLAVWICDGGGGNCAQVARTLGALAPQWSPDGQWIAFAARDPKTANESVNVVNVASGFTRQLTAEGASNHTSPSWSRDGRHIYFASDRSGRYEVWKMPAEGGRAAQVTVHGGGGVLEADDGGLYFSRGWPDGPLWRMPAGSREEELVVDKPLAILTWTLWKDTLVYFDYASEGPVLEMWGMKTRRVTRLATLEPRSLPWWGLTVSPDGKWILYSQRDSSPNDIMLIENFQ